MALILAIKDEKSGFFSKIGESDPG